MKYLREKAFRQIFFFHNSQFLCKVWSLAETILAALQAATILVARVSEKSISRPKILTKVANWRPTDYNRNLLGKLIDVWSNYQK